jgi:hypothetical protein
MNTSCECCGQEWETPPTLAVSCPKCGAAEGRPCVDRKPSGHVHNARFGGLHPWGHVEREAEALRRGLIQKCPAGRSAQQAAQGSLF